MTRDIDKLKEPMKDSKSRDIISRIIEELITLVEKDSNELFWIIIESLEIDSKVFKIFGNHTIH